MFTIELGKNWTLEGIRELIKLSKEILIHGGLRSIFLRPTLSNPTIKAFRALQKIVNTLVSRGLPILVVKTLENGESISRS